MSERENLFLDKERVRATFNKAALRYENFDFLQREVALRLLDKLESCPNNLKTIVDLGCGTGRTIPKIQERFNRARLVCVDIAETMLAVAKKANSPLFRKKNFFLCADAENIPLKSETVDLVYSNLSIQWCPKPFDVFVNVNNILKSSGVFVFSTLGPDTLKELRESFEGYSSFSHTSQFLDMHQIGDYLANVGMKNVVIERETLVVNYDEPLKLMKDLKGLGATNASSKRNKNLTAPDTIRKVINSYNKKKIDGKIPATYEVIYGYASANLNEARKPDIEKVISWRKK
ncbi:MAG: malonyl-ACP O-methyltransferase BioC [Pseudomonadota bacterium]|nr:malonyl-ACP O-methyltransferase BioC [Pseudomonadota bacterium]